jgi:divalent anion:Na+ symporter, DASS family
LSKRNSILIGLAALLGVFFLSQPPVGLSVEGWRLTGLFIATILGLMLEPMPGGAMVLIAVTFAAALKILPLKTALSGYADPTVWLVLAAYFISRALIKSGLARRIALMFVRGFGKSSLGVCYSLSFSDLFLASIIPSVAARSGGVVLPIAKSIADLYDSQPGPTAKRIGAFLMLGVYQAVCVGAAMFLTGQASNPLVAKYAATYGVKLDYATWMLAGCVPGMVSMLLVPYIVFRLFPPEIKVTPEAKSFATDKLVEMGAMSTAEKIVLTVFGLVCAGWTTSSWTGLDITLTALLGSVILLLCNVLTWDDIKNEKSAWDIFLWYGGLYMLGKALNDSGATTLLANGVANQFGGLEWPIVFAGLLLFFFYAHYGFASITAHVMAMYPAFLGVLAAKGAPMGLAVLAFGTFANFSAGLTHYGTTPGPMFFAHGYVTMRDWWRVGAIVSLVNLLIWSTIGFLWWKLLGWW